MKNFKPYIVPIATFVIIDQLVKLIISRMFINYDFDIIAGILRFRPKQNINLSYAGNYIEIFSNPWVVNILNVLIILIFISGYLFYKVKRERASVPAKIIIVCGLAGSICSLIDKLFWGGSLDFLQIPRLFTFDLKDCYLTITQVVFLIVGIKHQKEISLKEYLEFCFYRRS